MQLVAGLLACTSVGNGLHLLHGFYHTGLRRGAGVCDSQWTLRTNLCIEWSRFLTTPTPGGEGTKRTVPSPKEALLGVALTREGT